MTAYRSRLVTVVAALGVAVALAAQIGAVAFLRCLSRRARRVVCGVGVVADHTRMPTPTSRIRVGTAHGVGFEIVLGPTDLRQPRGATGHLPFEIIAAAIRPEPLVLRGVGNSASTIIASTSGRRPDSRSVIRL